MADYSWGGEGLMEGIQVLGGLEELHEKQALFPSILSGERLDIQQKKTTLDLSNLELQRQRTEMSALQRAISKGSFGSGDLTDNLNTLADIALEADKPSEANQYARTAADLARQRASLDNAQMTQAQKVAGVLGSLLQQTNVHDQASYDRFRQSAQLQASMIGAPGVAQAVANLPGQYNPQVMDNLRNGWQTILQTAQTKATQSRQQASEAEVEHYDFLDRQAAAETRYYDARAKALGKAGAGQILPKAGDIKVITDLMSEEYGDPSDLNQASRFRNRALPVAERMLEILKANPGMKQSQAAKQAFQEARQNGMFGGLKVNRPRLGSQYETPAPLPESKDQAKDNTWYNVNGKSMLLMQGKLYSKAEVDQMQQADNEEQEDEDESDSDEDSGDEDAADQP